MLLPLMSMVFETWNRLFVLPRYVSWGFDHDKPKVRTRLRPQIWKKNFILATKILFPVFKIEFLHPEQESGLCYPSILSFLIWNKKSEGKCFGFLRYCYTITKHSTAKNQYDPFFRLEFFANESRFESLGALVFWHLSIWLSLKALNKWSYKMIWKEWLSSWATMHCAFCCALFFALLLLQIKIIV